MEKLDDKQKWFDQGPPTPKPTRRRGKPLVPPAWYAMSVDYRRDGRIDIDVTTKGRSAVEAAAGYQRTRPRRRRKNRSRVILLIPGPNRMAPITTRARTAVRKRLESVLAQAGDKKPTARDAGLAWLSASPGSAVAVLEAVGRKGTRGTDETRTPDVAETIGRMLLARRRGTPHDPRNIRQD